jgi:hypothetical protein
MGGAKLEAQRQGKREPEKGTHKHGMMTMGGGKGGKGNNRKGYCIPFMIDEMPPQCPRRSIFL